MMGIKHNKAEEVRKLVAVIGACNLGLYLRNLDTGGVQYLSSAGGLTDPAKFYNTLEEALSDGTGRTPVYKGDSITLQF